MNVKYPTFNWWFGKVENRNDPLKLGRVKVRVFGYHTNDTEKIPTKSLPWYHVIQPITSGSMNGIGTTPIGPVEGTHVIGFFKDGDSLQDGVVLGTIGGIEPTTKQENTVEWDMSGITFIYNGIEYPISNRLDEPDTNRLAINDISKPHPILQIKNNSLDETIPTADFTGNGVEQTKITSSATTSLGSTWSEKESPYDAKYPFNHVKETESGHIEEWDDTPGKERYHRYHKSGTLTEIHDDGTKVDRIVNDKYEIVTNDEYIHVKGKVNKTIDEGIKIFVNKSNDFGNHYDVVVGKNSNVNIEVKEGNVNIKLDKGDMNTELANGNMNTRVVGNVDLRVTGDFDALVDGEYNLESTGNMTLKGDNIYIN